MAHKYDFRLLTSNTSPQIYLLVFQTDRMGREFRQVIFFLEIALCLLVPVSGLLDALSFLFAMIAG